MNLDFLNKVHAAEQRVMATMTFLTAHMSDIQQIKSDIADLFKMIADLKAEAQQMPQPPTK